MAPRIAPSPARHPRTDLSTIDPSHRASKAVRAGVTKDEMLRGDGGVLLSLGEGKALRRTGRRQESLTVPQTMALRTFLGALTSLPPELRSWRTREAAEATVDGAPVVSGSPLGKLAIIRTGGSNFAPSAAFVFRTAMYSERTVLSYQNSTDSTQNILREVKHIEGVPVPASLRGKIFAIGSPAPALAGLETASDNFIEQLAQMQRQKRLLGVDALQAHATVIGHSQGGVDATLTRQRLNAAGLVNAFGKVVLTGSGLRFPSEMPLFNALGKTIVPALEALGPAPDARASLELAADQRRLLKDDSLVDLSVAGRIGPKASWRLRFGIPPFEIVDPNRIKPALRAAALGLVPFGGGFSLDTLLGADDSSDGMVPNAASRVGKDYLLLSRPHDHTGMFEDPWVVDEIVKRLERR